MSGRPTRAHARRQHVHLSPDRPHARPRRAPRALTAGQDARDRAWHDGRRARRRRRVEQSHARAARRLDSRRAAHSRTHGRAREAGGACGLCVRDLRGDARRLVGALRHRPGGRIDERAARSARSGRALHGRRRVLRVRVSVRHRGAGPGPCHHRARRLPSRVADSSGRARRCHCRRPYEDPDGDPGCGAVQPARSEPAAGAVAVLRAAGLVSRPRRVDPRPRGTGVRPARGHGRAGVCGGRRDHPCHVRDRVPARHGARGRDRRRRRWRVAGERGVRMGHAANRARARSARVRAVLLRVGRPRRAAAVRRGGHDGRRCARGLFPRLP